MLNILKLKKTNTNCWKLVWKQIIKVSGDLITLPVLLLFIMADFHCLKVNLKTGTDLLALVSKASIVCLRVVLINGLLLFCA